MLQLAPYAKVILTTGLSNELFLQFMPTSTSVVCFQVHHSSQYPCDKQATDGSNIRFSAELRFSSCATTRREKVRIYLVSSAASIHTMRPDDVSLFAIRCHNLAVQTLSRSMQSVVSMIQKKLWFIHVLQARHER